MAPAKTVLQRCFLDLDAPLCIVEAQKNTMPRHFTVSRYLYVF